MPLPAGASLTPLARLWWGPQQPAGPLPATHGSANLAAPTVQSTCPLPAVSVARWHGGGRQEQGPLTFGSLLPDASSSSVDPDPVPPRCCPAPAPALLLRCCACTGVLALRCAALPSHSHSQLSYMCLQAVGGRLGRSLSCRHQQPRRAAGSGDAAPVCRPAWRPGDSQRRLLGWLAQVPAALLRSRFLIHCIAC